MSSLGIKPPSNQEAEIACLGSILLKNTLIDDVFAIINPQDFYDGRHRIIAQSIFDHRSKRGQEPIDLVTLTNQLRTDEHLSAAGGAEYLSDLISLVPTTSNAEHYAQIVSEKSLLRKVIDTGNDIIADASKEELDVHQILDQAQKKIFDLVKERQQEFEN